MIRGEMPKFYQLLDWTTVFLEKQIFAVFWWSTLAKVAGGGVEDTSTTRQSFR
jgi:hypothetical protein